MNLIFLGPPGAGKGTQAKELERRFGYRQISTGDILRANVRDGTALGREAKSFMDAGKLVPDDVIIGMVEPEVIAPGHVIFDGFPRTAAQAQALDDLLARNARSALAVLFEIDMSVLFERLAGRWTHVASGRSYHVVHRPPVVAGLDDDTGEPLIQRPDDQDDKIRTRLSVYETETAPLVAYYEKSPSTHLVRIDALAPIAVVTEQLDSLVRNDTSQAGQL